jgi:nicotinamide-nucleotide amidase
MNNNELTEHLLQHKQTIAIAESCTGGYISHIITSKSGSSKYFSGSIVAYSNNVKENILGVNKNDIIKYGAVSKQVVEQMASGVRQKLNSDFSIATSGIAGPDGGSKEKPVGTIWIAVSSKNGTISKMFSLNGNRQENIKQSSYEALELIKESLFF